MAWIYPPPSNSGKHINYKGLEVYIKGFLIKNVTILMVTGILGCKFFSGFLTKNVTILVVTGNLDPNVANHRNSFYPATELGRSIPSRTIPAL